MHVRAHVYVKLYINVLFGKGSPILTVRSNLHDKIIPSNVIGNMSDRVQYLSGRAVISR